MGAGLRAVVAAANGNENFCARGLARGIHKPDGFISAVH